MAPVRKKSKLSNENDPEAQPEPAGVQQQQAPPALPSHSHTIPTTVQGGSSPLNYATKQPLQPGNRGGWSESWRSKASPVAQVVRHSISVDRGVSSDSPDQDDTKPRPAHSVSKSFKGGSRKSDPLVGEATKVHATSDVSQPPKPTRHPPGTSQEKSQVADVVEDKKVAEEAHEEGSHPPPDVDMGDGDSGAETVSENPRPTSGSWFGWWSRPDDYGSNPEKIKSVTKAQLDMVAKGQQEDDSINHNNTNNKASDAAGVVPDQMQADENTPSNVADSLKPEMSANVGSGRSWFRLWSSTQNEQAAEEDRQRRESEHTPEALQSLPVREDGVTAVLEPQQTPNELGVERPKSSGWAFWSKDRQKDLSLEKDDASMDVGELAVADTPSQSHPEAAQFNREHEGKKTGTTDVKRNSSLLRMKRGRADQINNAIGEKTAASTPAESQVQNLLLSQSQTPQETPESAPAPVRRGKKPQIQSDLILPSFRDTYPASPAPGVVERLTHYLAQSLHIPGYEVPKQPQYPYIVSNPPKVKKAVAIGVHGYFPAALFQRVIGQPTGTSIRFSNYAAASIKQWCQDHQSNVKDVDIEKVALEGEGSIADRVTILWKLLLNWLSHLRQADLIFVACHSQGVPVAIMLVAKLIQLGCLNSHVRLGICAMAGINLGPFSEYKTRFFGNTALELFDFSDRNSKVSIAYTESLDLCLRHGVRVTFVGSIDDQLVSLESSLHMPLSHPYVSRAVFIDGRLHPSSFLTHLVVFALKLRNLGVSDHGLIRELSAPLAGSLVGGEGHSRLYDDPLVYQNAVEFSLESTDMPPAAFVVPPSPEEKRKSVEAARSRRASLAEYPTNMVAANKMRRGSFSSFSVAAPGIAPVMAPYEPPGSASDKNPFVLPWAVRGLLSEDIIKHDAKLQLEVKELVQEFESWRPTSKVLKDVRWRLEGVRSML